ncbi:MBL fold metallo-hydrolase [Actinosynnema sp. NPDC020468]|uniref:MBL fold metallo-hydrolase n=1 Tax=Actinosynnema sp. NPDC020468 TaxID=3154488 RepID=UPI0033E0CD7E
MNLTVLGTATPYPRPDQACSGYLLTAGDTTVWIDAGPGTLANLQRHVRPDHLTAIWISHTHADHTADLLAAYYALRFGDLPPTRVPLYGPPGLAHRLETFLAAARPNPAADAFDIHELTDGHTAHVGDLELTSLAVDHGLPAFGLRARADDRVLGYSGDTAPCAALDRIADADLLLCEAGTGPHHCTVADAVHAGRHADRYLLTHLGEHPGDAPVARQGATYPV